MEIHILFESRQATNEKGFVNLTYNKIAFTSKKKELAQRMLAERLHYDFQYFPVNDTNHDGTIPEDFDLDEACRDNKPIPTTYYELKADDAHNNDFVRYEIRTYNVMMSDDYKVFLLTNTWQMGGDNAVRDILGVFSTMTEVRGKISSEVGDVADWLKLSNKLVEDGGYLEFKGSRFSPEDYNLYDVQTIYICD